MATRLKLLFQFRAGLYSCVSYAVILYSFVFFVSEERHGAVTCLVSKAKCSTTDNKKASSYGFMALEALRPSDHLLQRASVYRALLWQKQRP
jgi:hypothetical protein